MADYLRSRGCRRLADVVPADLDAYLLSLVDRQSRASRVQVAGVIRRFFRGLQERGLVLSSPARDLPVKVSWLRHWLGRISRELGRRVHPHLLRHSIAVHLLRGKADVRYVQEFLGHSCLDTTKIYLRLVPGRLKEEYERAMPEMGVM
jgi:site-specific recombinase XerD